MHDLTEVAKRITDLEHAAYELADAAMDVVNDEHLHGDHSPQFRDSERHYVNWKSIVRQMANDLRASLFIPESRPDLDAYVAPTEGV